MKSLISLFAIAVVLLNVEGCRLNQSSAVDPFEINKYFGKWYMFSVYCPKPKPTELDCSSFIAGSSPNGNVTVTVTYKNITEKTTDTFEGEIQFDEPYKGHFTYDTPAGLASSDIAAIDYEKYFIEFACDEDCVAVYTRSPDPPKETLNEIDDFIKKNNIDESSATFFEQDVNKCDF